MDDWQHRDISLGGHNMPQEWHVFFLKCVKIWGMTTGGSFSPFWIVEWCRMLWTSANWMRNWITNYSHSMASHSMASHSMASHSMIFQTHRLRMDPVPRDIMATPVSKFTSLPPLSANAATVKFLVGRGAGGMSNLEWSWAEGDPRCVQDFYDLETWSGWKHRFSQAWGQIILKLKSLIWGFP